MQIAAHCWFVGSVTACVRVKEWATTYIWVSYFWLWCCVHQNFYDLYQLAHSSNQHTKMENRRLNYANYVDGFLFVLRQSECAIVFLGQKLRCSKSQRYGSFGSQRAEIKQSHRRYRTTAKKQRQQTHPTISWRRRFSCHFAVNTDFVRFISNPQKSSRGMPKTAPKLRSSSMWNMGKKFTANKIQRREVEKATLQYDRKIWMLVQKLKNMRVSVVWFE